MFNPILHAWHSDSSMDLYEVSVDLWVFTNGHHEEFESDITAVKMTVVVILENCTNFG